MLRATTTPQLWGNGDDCGTIRPTARKRDRRAVSVRERHGDERSVARAVEKESRAGRPLGARVREKRRRRRRERRFAEKDVDEKSDGNRTTLGCEQKGGKRVEIVFRWDTSRGEGEFCVERRKSQRGVENVERERGIVHGDGYRSIGE